LPFKVFSTIEYGYYSNQYLPALVVIKSDKGVIFGGFTMRFWYKNDKNYSIKDKNAFLFNLTSKKIFKVALPELAIRSDKKLQFCFGKNALSVSIQVDRKYNNGVFSDIRKCRSKTEAASTSYGIQLDENDISQLTGES
jgi:hypothetical protein